MTSYYKFWDELKEKGILFEYQTPEGIMIDNGKILELTRAKENLVNPNMIQRWFINLELSLTYFI